MTGMNTEILGTEATDGETRALRVRAPGTDIENSAFLKPPIKPAQCSDGQRTFSLATFNLLKLTGTIILYYICLYRPKAVLEHTSAEKARTE